MTKFRASLRELCIHNNIKIFKQHTYKMDHQCYDSKFFLKHLYIIKSELFQKICNLEQNLIIINITSCLNLLRFHELFAKLNNWEVMLGSYFSVCNADSVVYQVRQELIRVSEFIAIQLPYYIIAIHFIVILIQSPITSGYASESN